MAGALVPAASVPLNEGLGLDGSLRNLPRAVSGKDGFDELAVARGPSCWARFVFEWKYENLWYTGNYPNTYGKLHWPRAFGAAGSGCWCCSRASGSIKTADFRPIPTRYWLMWRVVVCAYLTSIFLYSTISFWNNGAWFEFLTNWQSTIFMVYGWLSLLSVLYIHRYYRFALEESFEQSAKQIGAVPGSAVPYKIPWLIKVTWVVQGLAMSLGIWVTCIFWLDVAAFGYYNPPRLPYNLLDHFSTIFIIVVDFSFAAFPWMLFQFVWSASIAIAFTIWSIIFFELNLTNYQDGGHYIYQVLDWTTPVRTALVIVVLIVVGAPLVNIIVWAVSSEQMNYCAPRRLVPWVEQDDTVGHRWKSARAINQSSLRLSAKHTSSPAVASSPAEEVWCYHNHFITRWPNAPDACNRTVSVDHI